MKTFCYVGDCAKGEVVFRETVDPGVERVTVMPKGKPVEVSDELARKFARNNHFVEMASTESLGGTSGDTHPAGREQAAALSTRPHNTDIARRASTVERRAIIAQLLREAPQNSDRKIAEALGVSHPTVGSVRAELEATGELDKVTSCIGADGKQRPR